MDRWTRAGVNPEYAAAIDAMLNDGDEQGALDFAQGLPVDEQQRISRAAAFDYVKFAFYAASAALTLRPSSFVSDTYRISARTFLEWIYPQGLQPGRDWLATLFMLQIGLDNAFIPFSRELYRLVTIQKLPYAIDGKISIGFSLPPGFSVYQLEDLWKTAIDKQEAAAWIMSGALADIVPEGENPDEAIDEMFGLDDMYSAFPDGVYRLITMQKWSKDADGDFSFLYTPPPRFNQNKLTRGGAFMNRILEAVMSSPEAEKHIRAKM